MNIDELSVGEMRQLIGLIRSQINLGAEQHPWEIGKPYLVRTVTMILTGRLVAVFPQELVLEDAAWIPDTGPFAEALRTGQFSEVEPFPAGAKVIIGRGAHVDATRLTTPLPRDRK